MTTRLNFNLNETDVSKFRKLAEKRKMTMTDLLREMIDHAYTEQRSAQDDLQEIKRIVRAMEKTIRELTVIIRQAGGN